MLAFVQKGYITKTIIDKKKSLGIKSRQIVASSDYAKKVVAKDAEENRESKLLPHQYPINFTTIIFGKSVAFISPNIQSMLLVIENEDFTESQLALFDALWDSL